MRRDGGSQRSRRRPLTLAQRAVATAAVLVLFAGVMLTVVGTGLLEPDQPLDDVSSGPGAGGDGSVDDPVVQPTETTTVPSGRSEVSGTVTALTAVDATVDLLPTPMTVDVAEPGLGRSGAVIRDAVVGGEPATIQWDSGRPLVLGGTGGLVLAPARVVVDGAGTSVSFGERTHGFAAGTYRIDTPVAVGTSGLAQPLDAVDFTATASTTITFAGDASTRVGPGSLTLTGPGTVTADGSFGITTSEGATLVDHIEFGPGPFQIGLTPGAGGLAIAATFDEPS